MKRTLAAAALGGALIVAAQAHGDSQPRSTVASVNAGDRIEWSAWTRPLAPAPAERPGVTAADPAPAEEPEAPLDDIDVVDAHWMALTMWGEGRSEGEAGMRAVGHVIRNRWLTGRGGAHVTGTVSEAWQFSCWNEGDPNRAAMLNIEALRKDSRDYRLWLAAKRLAAEILAGRSSDPTGGALFYHTTGVQPAWSAGIAPVTQIGSHLFFRTVR